MNFFQQITSRISVGFALIALFLCLADPAAAQQPNAAALEKMRQMGLTEEQVRSYMQEGQGQSSVQGNQRSSAYPYQQPYANPQYLSGTRRTRVFPRDSIAREFLIEELDLINPSKLQKILSDRIDREGVLMDVRGYERGGVSGLPSTGEYLPGIENTRGSIFDTERRSLLDEELLTPKDSLKRLNEYEIVIRDGKFMKRETPVVFGREIFTGKNLTFEPNYHMATPPDYVLGPNDELLIEAWGTAEFYAREKVTPDGTVTIQSVGPVPVGGLTMAEAEGRIRSRVAQVMSGAQTKVSLGRIRSIKVNIVGEAMVPGSYTLPSLATAFNALYMAGGVNDIGSLRSIRIYRGNGELKGTVDVYDYLINGYSDSNIRLEDNDVINIPPYEKYVMATGRVKRERTYEMKEGETLAELLKYAGGFTGDAYRENVNLQRQTGRQYSVVTVDRPDFAAFKVEDGDKVSVDKIIEDFANRLTIAGAVWRPGDYELSERTATLSRLIKLAEGLRGDEFASRGQVTRRKPDFTYEIIPFDVREVAVGRADLTLQPEDLVYIPNILEMRETYTVAVKGEVNKPGTIPFRDGMTVEDVILLSSGLRESASLANIEVARRVKDPNSTEYTNRTADIYSFPVASDLRLSSSDAAFILHPFDEVFVRRSPGYSEQQNVTVDGEVLYAGDYVLATAGERISDVIRKAGGITPEAYIKGASVKRQLTDDEKARVESMLKITTGGTMSISEDELEAALGTSYPIGVNVAQAIENPGCDEDIILRDGDEIFIPKYNSTVKISGSVLYPNSVTYAGGSIKSYISQAGGYTKKAWKKPYVIYMNGKVASTRSRGGRPHIEPGCEIVVPPKERSGEGLATLATIVSLLGSTATSAASAAALVNATR